MTTMPALLGLTHIPKLQLAVPMGTQRLICHAVFRRNVCMAFSPSQAVPRTHESWSSQTVTDHIPIFGYTQL